MGGCQGLTSSSYEVRYCVAYLSYYFCDFCKPNIRRENFIQLFTKKSPKAKKKKKAAMLQRQEEGRKGQIRLEGALVHSQICQMSQCARPVPKQACG